MWKLEGGCGSWRGDLEVGGGMWKLEGGCGSWRGVCKLEGGVEVVNAQG